jgi:hypothetical protein
MIPLRFYYFGNPTGFSFRRLAAVFYWNYLFADSPSIDLHLQAGRTLSIFNLSSAFGTRTLLMGLSRLPIPHPRGCQMSEDFKNRLIAHAQVAIDRAGRSQSEAATQQYLVLPFVQLLGYDPLNPDEVIPEAHASFSEKFKNRVDYAICIDREPAIAVECKCVGRLSEANRGELKGYFNAVLR